MLELRALIVVAVATLLLTMLFLSIPLWKGLVLGLVLITLILMGSGTTHLLPSVIKAITRFIEGSKK
jgi:hypothetical protein